MDRNLALNLVRVTESAALNASKYFGQGDSNIADAAAVEGMRKMFDTLNIRGEVVIGEGEMDEAPMLYIGEKIGSADNEGIEVDIAVDPLDGTNAVAKGFNNSISVVAVAPKGTLLNSPDMYMDKLAVGPKAKDVVSLENTLTENIHAVAKAVDKDVEDLTVTLLERDRHEDMIKEIRSTGARIRLFRDGDVEAAIATCMVDSGVDMLVGIGGAPEGVLAAAALKCLGGYFAGRLYPTKDEEIERCKKMGIEDLDKIYTIDDLVASDEVMFAATGISQGEFLKGIKHLPKGRVKTHSVVMRSETGTVRYIEAIHKLERKPEYARPETI